MRGLLLLSAVLAVNGQEEPRIGSDGRPLLNKPDVDLCKNRPFHEKYGNHHYFLSWREPWNKFEVNNKTNHALTPEPFLPHFICSEEGGLEFPALSNVMI